MKTKPIRRLILYKAHHTFKYFVNCGIAEFFDEKENYGKDDLIICPVFWGLDSIDQVISTDYNLALENRDKQGYHNPLIPADIVQILDKYNAKLLLFNDWEARDLDSISSELLIFTSKYLKQPLKKVIYSTCSYTGHMIKPKYPHILSYDWMHLIQKSFHVSNEVIETKEDKKYPILSLNYRGNMERYAYCFYLFNKYHDKALFSYLDYPADDSAKKLNANFKKVLGSVFSEESQENFNNGIPFKIDGALPAQHQTQTLQSFFKQSYVHVMFETNWMPESSSTQQISEKSYINIRTGKPFIIFTTQGGVLAHMRKLGFRTFAPFIDESYDNPKFSYFERFDLLLKETDRICNLSENDLKKLDEGLKPSVEYNLYHLANNKDVPNFFEMIDEDRLGSFNQTITGILAVFKIFNKKIKYHWIHGIRPIFLQKKTST